jgi:excisionase family DNA binding protein
MSPLSTSAEELQERRREPSFEEVFRLLAKIRPPEGNPPDSHPKAEFINTHAAAAWLGISRRSMQRYVQSGILPSYKLGKQRLFRRSELLEALGASRKATRAEILR